MYFGTFYLDQEKDIPVVLFSDSGVLSYVLRTPNHKSGNLITNLARLCGLPLSIDEETGLKVIRGEVPCYLDADDREVYILRLGDTKVANIYPDGTMERKATLPAIAKTLMSQTKDYRLSERQTLVKSYILKECKFHSDLHTHMNANLPPDLLIALGIFHQIRYPLYYIKKLSLRLTPAQERVLSQRRAQTALRFADSPLTGKYLERRIDDNTFINFARLMLADPENASCNLPRIRASLAIPKDGQAVFTNLEKVYLYRYVFTKGIAADDPLPGADYSALPDPDIRAALRQMEKDRRHPVFAQNTLFENKLLWIARNLARFGVYYAEISDTSLLKPDQAPGILASLHRVLPAVQEETGVLLRFLGAFRRIPLTIIRDRPSGADLISQLKCFYAAASDPYVAGCDIIGEELNDIRELRPLLTALTRMSLDIPGFVMRVHAGENDGLRSNVRCSVQCILSALKSGEKPPLIRVGHGLYTENLRSEKGRQLLDALKTSGAVLEFQITSNVRLNNLSEMGRHPLREYLAAGIPCVQGTDGAGIYGTNSIDEQLSLERMLHLSHEEMIKMRRTEDRILEAQMNFFRQKEKLFAASLEQAGGLSALFERRLANCPEQGIPSSPLPVLSDSAQSLSARIQPLPSDGLPVVVAGGSFGSIRQKPALRRDILTLLDRIIETADPEKVFFVIGDRFAGYEKYLADRAKGRFRVFAFVPACLSPDALRRVRKNAGVSVRVSIETPRLGLYKSLAYEVFKRRFSLLLALDGSSACANLIQEAKNSRYKTAIFADARCGAIRRKADSLEGYVHLFRRGEELFPQLKEALHKDAW